jgi:hypothetical protein
MVFGYDAVYMILFGMEIIKAGLILNDEKNEQTGGDADGEAYNIYCGITFIPQQVPPGGFDVIS